MPKLSSLYNQLDNLMIILEQEIIKEKPSFEKIKEIYLQVKEVEAQIAKNKAEESGNPGL